MIARCIQKLSQVFRWCGIVMLLVVLLVGLFPGYRIQESSVALALSVKKMGVIYKEKARDQIKPRSGDFVIIPLRRTCSVLRWV